MITAGFLILGIISILSLLFFNVTKLWLILDLVICMVVIVLKIIIFKKLPKFVDCIIESLLLIACVVLLFLVKPGENDYSLTDYQNSLSSVQSKITSGAKRVDEDLEKLSEQYGFTDDVLSLYAYKAILDGQSYDARNYIDDFRDKTSVDYYTRLEAIYILEGRNKNQFMELYTKAANDQPYWKEAQKRAGISCYENENYAGATVYLTRALELDSLDAESFYYLGVVYFEQDNFDYALHYFSLAMECGANEEIQSYIKWYASKITED